MLDSLVLFHSKESRPLEFLDAEMASGTWVSWSTCLRSILIGEAETLPQLKPSNEKIETYRGADAYRFCLEVVCGLHSPLVGETEVMGQFKEIAKKTPLLKTFFQSILTDAKIIRSAHLKNLGSQSYGSLARKFLKQSRSIHMIGAGHLAEELLPWMKDFESVEIFCRNPEKRKALLARHPQAKLLSLEDEEHSHADGNALILAAPMSAAEILSWMERHGHVFDCLLDLRGDAETDPIDAPNVVHLGDFFSEVKKNKDVIHSRVELAIHEIRKLSLSRFRAVDHRPFGWDDICA